MQQICKLFADSHRKKKRSMEPTCSSRRARETRLPVAKPICISLIRTPWASTAFPCTTTTSQALPRVPDLLISQPMSRVPGLLTACKRRMTAVHQPRCGTQLYVSSSMVQQVGHGSLCIFKVCCVFKLALAADITSHLLE